MLPERYFVIGNKALYVPCICAQGMQGASRTDIVRLRQEHVAPRDLLDHSQALYPDLTLSMTCASSKSFLASTPTVSSSKILGYPRLG